MRFSLLSVAALLVASSSALVIKRQSGTTCGSKYYSSSAVNSAVNAAYDYEQSGSTAGGSSYPHQYNDYEGFSFDNCEAPYYEFPLVSNGPYSGGAPGADRVVIDGYGDYCGSITHSGASGNNFVSCN